MADISKYLKAIKEAIYGEEVRGSIHDALEIINEEATAEKSLKVHKNAVVLDHPDGSVTTSKIAPKSIAKALLSDNVLKLITDAYGCKITSISELEDLSTYFDKYQIVRFDTSEQQSYPFKKATIINVVDGGYDEGLSRVIQIALEEDTYNGGNFKMYSRLRLCMRDETETWSYDGTEWEERVFATSEELQSLWDFLDTEPEWINEWKLMDEAVTTSKIADGSVTSEKLADDVKTKLNNSAQLDEDCKIKEENMPTMNPDSRFISGFADTALSNLNIEGVEMVKQYAIGEIENQKGVAGGIAPLTDTCEVPFEKLPYGDLAQLASDISNSNIEANKGLRYGVAPLDENAKVPADFLPITQTTGQSESNVMSQKAVTDELNQTNRSLDYLWKISKGKLYDTEIVTSYAANVSAPSGAMQYAQLHKLGGSTLLFNQLVTNGNFQDLSNWDVYKGTGSVSNNVLTVTGATGRGGVRQNVHEPVYVNHIYYLSCTYTSTKGFTVKPFSANSYYLNFPTQEEPTYVNARFTAPEDTTTTFDMFPTDKYEVGDFTISNLMLIDLTQMFGVGSEPRTAEEFRSILLWDYYDTTTEITKINSPVYTIRSEQSLIEFDIPKAIRNLDGYGKGYGDSYNYVDFVDKEFYRVGEWSSDGEWVTYGEPVITDISTFLPDDFDIIDIVDDTGVVSFYCYDDEHNRIQGDFNLPVHSEIEFMIDIAEVV